MSRACATACCGALISLAGAFSGCGGGGQGDAGEQAALERFVEAWPAGGSTLAKTTAGPDSPRLVAALAGLQEGGVIRATLERVSEATDGSGPLEGVAVLRFADGAQVELNIRATLEGDRVLAEPAAISTRLLGWKRLRVEKFGTPVAGEILSRRGTPLTLGADAEPVAARPALAPAVSQIARALKGQLVGRPGRRVLAGEPPRVLGESTPADGEDVATSIDVAMQAAAERTLGSAPGALVAVDPRTGGIRALVSNPETRAPHVSPATAGYSPGSAFKIVTAAAALEADVLGPADIVPCPARTTVDEAQITNFQDLGYGPITFEKAFAVSCNTAFAQVGLVLGTADLLGTAQDLGFRVGTLDRPDTISVPESSGELAVWSFGAAGSLVSPVHLAGIGATVARGGLAVSPGWVDRPEAGERVLSESTAATLVAMMEEVVESGTGKRAAVPHAQIAGKTGTAEPRRAGAGSDSWFVGLAPSRDTRLVVVGFLPGAGLGGDLAASLVRNFLLATARTWR